MNCYTYDEISVGDTETFTVTITNTMMRSFMEMTGDVNPLHADQAFAAAAGFPRSVAYGMLTASFLSTLAGVYLPGLHSLIHQSEVAFPAPVFVGDTLTFVGQVVAKDDRFRRIELSVTARNEAGKKVLRGKMWAGVLK